MFSQRILRSGGLIALVALALGGCERASTPSLDSDEAKASYALGQNIGNNFRNQQMSIDVAAFSHGLERALKGEDSVLTNEEMDQALRKMQESITRKVQEEGEQNLLEGRAFLEQNSQNPDVMVTESGLQYQILKEGDGPTPGPNDTVVAHYTGVLLNGSKFDSSFDRGQPAEFPVSGVIPGWQEALQMMPQGSVWKLFIPPELAYGEIPRPGIPANSVLVFDVELVDVKTN